MLVYGYVRINSASGYNGKEADVQVFETREVRDHMMYEDYVESFDDMVANNEIGEKDINGNTKQTRDDFLSNMRRTNTEQEVYGRIQAKDYHIQFEPFCKAI